MCHSERSETESKNLGTRVPRVSSSLPTQDVVVTPLGSLGNVLAIYIDTFPPHYPGASQGGSGGNVGFTAVQSASPLGRPKGPGNLRKFPGDSLHTFSSVRKYAPGGMTLTYCEDPSTPLRSARDDSRGAVVFWGRRIATPVCALVRNDRVGDALVRGRGRSAAGTESNWCRPG